MSSILRSIARRTARTNMERAGHTKVAKKKRNPLTGEPYSYFQENWKKFV